MVTAALPPKLRCFVASFVFQGKRFVENGNPVVQSVTTGEIPTRVAGLGPHGMPRF